MAALALPVLAGLKARANDIEPGKEFYSAIKTPRPIVLDGSLSEWGEAAVLADPRFSIPKGSGAGGTLTSFELYDAGGPGTADWTGPEDQTSAVQIVYDADNVYFGFVVTDDYHENAANSPWNGDSVQLMIANAERNLQVALYNYALGGVEDSLGQVIIQTEAGPGGTDAVITRNTVTKRTTYEVKLPKEALGLESLTAGTRFGLGMAINDGDQLAPGQQGWGGLGAHALVFGKSPSETALVTLAASNDIEPGKEIYTANPLKQTFTLDGSLTEWSGIPVLSDPRFSIPKGSGRNGTPVLFELYDGGGPGVASWTGPDDQTSAVQIGYDAENVYFGITVTDDYHENAANSPWNGDSVQLMIANGAQNQQIALYNYALGGVEDALGQVIIQHEAGPGGTEAMITRNSTTKRTVYEIKLPKASMGLESLALGTQFGLGMAINDGDQDAPGQQGWGGLGAHALVFGKSPSETALVTLGTGGTTADVMFLSAVSSGMYGFSFRVNDRGASILDPATVRLTIDGTVVALTAKPKNLDASDFAYTRPTPYPPGSSHTYTVEAKDTAGKSVVDSSNFKIIPYAVLTKSMQAVSVDKTKPGFIWNIFQNESYQHTNLTDTELALAGQLKNAGGEPVTDNYADPAVVGPALGEGVKAGPLYRFEIPTYINFSQTGGDANGNFTPDDQMPGLPGTSGSTDGVDAEAITFVELPAGWLTMGVNSDDGFRTQAGYINVPADGLLLGEFNAGRGATDTTFRILVQDAGIYPLRTIWQEGGGGANIEIFTVAEDGTKSLINDIANGGFPSWRSGVAPAKPPVPFSLEVRRVDGAVELLWTEPDTVLQQSEDLKTWVDLPTAVSPWRPVLTGNSSSFFRLKKY